MIGVLGGGRRSSTVGLLAVSFGAAKGLKEGHGNKPSSIWQGWVACFIPVGVAFSADNMEEVASRKAQLLR